jgi:hypothetical protein
LVSVIGIVSVIAGVSLFHSRLSVIGPVSCKQIIIVPA